MHRKQSNPANKHKSFFKKSNIEEMEEEKIVTPELIENVEPQPAIVETPVDWTVHLDKATNGRVKTAEELSTIFTQYEESQSKASKLQAQWESLDPISKKRVEMLSAGASDSEFDAWYNLQKIDVAKLSDVDIVRQEVKIKNPSVSDADIQEWLEDKFGDLEDLKGSKKIEFSQAAQAARQFLSSQIVAASTPESLRSKQEIEMKQQQYLGEVQKEFSILKTSDYLSKVAINNEDGTVAMELPVPEAVREQVYKYAEMQIREQGIDPKNKEAVQEVMQQYLWALDRNRMIGLIRADERAKSIKEGIKANAGAAIKPEVSQSAPATSPSLLDAFLR